MFYLVKKVLQILAKIIFATPLKIYSVCRNRRLTIRLLPIFTKLLSRNILSVTNNIQSDVLRELNIVD